MADATAWGGAPKQKKASNSGKRQGGTPGQGLAKGVSTSKSKGSGRSQPGLGRSDNDGYPYRT